MISKPGNPHGRPKGDKLKKVSFMLDPETLSKLQDLENSIARNIYGRRSVAIRQAIHGEHARHSK
jgi:predicted transcriptional regulator